MPHYGSGRPAALGELVITTENNQQTVSILVGVDLNKDTCNGRVLPLTIRIFSTGLGWGPWTNVNGVTAPWCVTLKNTFPAVEEKSWNNQDEEKASK